MIKRLIWTIWTLISSVLKKADKLNLSLSPSLSYIETVCHKPHVIRLPPDLNSQAHPTVYAIKYAHCFGYIDGLVQDYSNSSALAMELLQSCTKPSISLF